MSCCCYRKGTNFQANHNLTYCCCIVTIVVVATAKVQIFKQITTCCVLSGIEWRCCCYRKGTNFQANHNSPRLLPLFCWLLLLPQRYKFSSKSQPLIALNYYVNVVVATAKVQIFKQITTCIRVVRNRICCCCYRKGTNFQANHNT